MNIFNSRNTSQYEKSVPRLIVIVLGDGSIAELIIELLIYAFNYGEFIETQDIFKAITSVSVKDPSG